MPKSEVYTAGELLSILSARQLRDGQVVFAGVGIPLLAATLAQRLRCPGLTILLPPFRRGRGGVFTHGEGEKSGPRACRRDSQR